MADTKPTVNIRKVEESDRPWVRRLWVEHWGGDFIVTRGKVYRYDVVDGFIAEVNGEKVGLITCFEHTGELEITSMDSLVENQGIGTALVDEVVRLAREKSLKRVMLITTNDNTHALRFWQRRSFRLAALYPEAIELSRRLKPTIPLIGNDGIPIRDEIELEITP